MSVAVFFRESDGCIVGYRSTFDGDQVEAPQGCDLVIVATPPKIPGYYDGSVCRPIPNAPDESHRWDWTAKQWLADADLAAAVQAKASADALASIDEAAGRTRLKYITSVPGQSETYQRKEAQARAWQSGGFAGPAPSFIAAEAEALNVSPESVATEVIGLADYWVNEKGPQIEACRRKWKVAIEAAGADLAGIRASLSSALVELAAL